MIPFTKYHGIGNDYIVINPAKVPQGLSPHTMQRICDRHRGVGSDGILWGPLTAAQADFGLEIYNPDGSYVEKSGNGLRIFARYLWDHGLVGSAPFTVETGGDVVTAQVTAGGREVTVQMGRVRFLSSEIPVTGPQREVLQEPITVLGQELRFSAATLGNPHCVVLLDAVSPEIAHTYGPALEVHPFFPNRTNVQFVQVLDKENIRVEIWERGAGYTLSSGSSSCAAVAVAHRLGLVGREVVSHMPGGELAIKLDEAFRATLKGPVVRVHEGLMAAEALEG